MLWDAHWWLLHHRFCFASQIICLDSTFHLLLIENMMSTVVLDLMHQSSFVFFSMRSMYKSTVLGTISSYFRVCIFRTSNERCKTFEVRPLTDCYLFLNRRYKFINYMFYLPYGTKTPWFYRLINKLLGFKVPFCSFV